ncbi:hypothetical protein V6N13_030833 [Hibiscus sabdariffa]
MGKYNSWPEHADSKTGSSQDKSGELNEHLTPSNLGLPVPDIADQFLGNYDRASGEKSSKLTDATADEHASTNSDAPAATDAKVEIDLNEGKF